MLVVLSLGDWFYVPVPLSAELENQHREVTLSYFIQLGSAGALAFKIHSVQADADQSILDSAVADMGYLTAQAMAYALYPCTLGNFT